MPQESIIKTKEFSYKIPNQVFSQDDSKNETASAIYTGPEMAWVFVDEETGKFDDTREPVFLEDDGPDYPAHYGTKKIKVSLETNPFEMALIIPENCETHNQTIVTETLPDGSNFEIEHPPSIDDTYFLDTLRYDFESETWQTPEYQTSGRTWDDVIDSRNNLLLASDGKISPDMPEDVKQPWIEYRKALRDLPTVFGRGTENEVPAWKVQFPMQPGEE